jgi:hypothetical protein
LPFSTSRVDPDDTAIDGEFVAHLRSSDPNSGSLPTWTLRYPPRALSTRLQERDGTRTARCHVVVPRRTATEGSEGFERDIARYQSDPVTRAQTGTGGSDALRLRLAWMCSRAAVNEGTSSSGGAQKTTSGQAQRALARPRQWRSYVSESRPRRLPYRRPRTGCAW